MGWDDDSWKDGYDAWKLASPYDGGSEEETEVWELWYQRAKQLEKTLCQVREIAKSGTRNTAAWLEIIELANQTLDQPERR